MPTSQQEAAWQQAVRLQMLFDRIDDLLIGDDEPGHDARPVTEVGPGGSASYAWCPGCGWRGPTRRTRDEAAADAEGHKVDQSAGVR